MAETVSLQAPADGSGFKGQSRSPALVHDGEEMDALSIEGAGSPMARGSMEDGWPCCEEGLSK